MVNYAVEAPKVLVCFDVTAGTESHDTIEATTYTKYKAVFFFFFFVAVVVVMIN